MKLKKYKSNQFYNNSESGLDAIYKENRLNFSLSIFGVALKSLAIVGFSVFSQRVLDTITGNEKNTFLYLVIFASVCLGLLSLAAVIEYKFWTAFRCKALFYYRRNTYDKVLDKSIYSFTKEKAATYLSALSNDLGEIRNNYLEFIPYAAELILSFIISVVVMFSYSFSLTLIALVVSLLPIIVSLFQVKSIAKCERDLSEANSHFLDKFAEIINGFPTIKSLMAEDRIMKWISVSNKLSTDAFGKREHVEIAVAYSAAVSGRLAEGIFLLVCLGFSHKLSISAGVVVVYVQLMANIIQVAISMPELIARIKAGKTLIEKHDMLLKENASVGIERKVTCNHGIEIRNLTASYGTTGIGIKNMSLSLKANGSYAIIGESGSGKSTLLKVLSGFHKEYSGDILYDGESIKDVSSSSIFNVLSVIYQDVFLFDASIKENITLFGEYKEDDLQDVIEKSGLSDLVAEKGLSYKCGNNGCNLSGGEKQRIGIARSIIKGTEVLLCDEITSSLDPKMGAKVIDVIQKMKDKTRIVVTHDIYPNLLEKFDGIIVLKDGEVVEQGTYRELIDRKAVLYKIVNGNSWECKRQI